MADSATIIAASLDSSQLETSINNLVETVDAKTKEMANKFTKEVGRMEQAVKNLGNIKIDSGGTADGGSSRRTSKQKEEETQVKATTQAYKEQRLTIDQQANAMQNAIRPKSAEDSYYTIIKNMRENVALLAMEIKSIPNVSLDKQFSTYMQYERQIEQLRQRIAELRQQMQEMANDPNASRIVKKQTLDEINSLQQKIVQLEREQITTTQQIANADKQMLAEKQAQYEKERQELIQLSVGERERVTFEKQQTNELNKQLQIVKEINSSKNAKAVYESISAMPTNTIEQANLKLQALQALKEKVANTPLLSKSSQLQLEQAITDTKGRIERIEMAARGTNQSKKSLDELNASIAQTIRREEERRNAILQTGVAAQEAFAKIRQSAQIQLADNTDKPIMGVKELTEAIRNMERAYWDMDVVNRESPLGQSLQRDIENAQKLRTAIEAYNKTLLGLPVIQDKNGVDKTLGSYTELSALLKTLSGEYRHLGREERNAAKGNDLADKIQRLGRETQKIQQQMNRPINLDAALKGSEKTIDDITYKIRRLQSYKVGIDLTKPNAANEIKQVDEAILRLQKDMDKYLGKSKDVLASNNALGRSWNYMKNRLAFYFTVGAGTQFVKNLIEVRSQYEMNERALGILINSAERGTQIFNELSQMALVSPYTLIEFSAAAKQLTAYDIAARDVVDTTRRLADMASAVGVPIERLTYALGQIKAYGYLNSRDARMFANAGIPLVKQLSDYYTELEGKMVSTADVYDRMKKKAIDYNSVMSVITKMTDEGGKFFDFQAKMADTLKVRLANLTLAWNNMLNDMGKETQGVLTFGIGALRELFLHWRQLDNAIRDAAWILGLRTGFMLIVYAALKAGNAMGVTSKQMALSSVVGTRLAGVLRTLGQSIATIAKSPLTWWSLLALAAWDIFDAFMNADKATIEFNKSLRDSAKTTYEDLKKFAEQYKNIRDSLYTTETIGNLGGKETTVTTPQNIEEGEAKKVWEAMREQIELSSHASDEYISKLLSIENVSERLRQGFQILDDIQTVSAALKEIGEDGIKVTQGWAAWWNAWQGADGLIGNVKDLQKEIQRLKDTGQDPNDKFTKVIDKDYATALERFRKDLKVTTDSVLDFINLNGWSGDTGKIDEVFKQVTDRLATQSNLDPQTAFTLQREVEVARAKAAKEALEIRIADEKKALATSSDEISKRQIQKNLETLEQQKRDFDKFNGENRAYWNDFTKYIKERHVSELTAAYNSMTDHGKKAMDFQSEEWQKRVHDWANRYEKSHNLATDSVFNRLRNWINDANTWSVFIKMTISTEDGKSVYKQLEEYDKAADDAWKTMQRLDKRISQLRKKGAKEVEGAETGAIDLSRVSADDKELTEALKERTQAQKDYNDAVEKGGESKKENSAASKAQKAAESELAKALKDELKLIETVRSSYKELTKEGASHTDAVKKSVSGYEKSVANINKVLEKYGVKLDLTKFAGIANPHELQEMFKQQLNALAGKAKPTEIQELEVELKKVDLDVDKYDLTKITKGLNNELDRLKDEYELAVSLDADPELGSMFADWMGIDVNDLPRTASEYAERASKELNKYLKENKANVELPNLLNVTDDDLRAFEEMKVLTDAQLENVRKRVQQARELQKKEVSDQIKDWDKLLEKYAEYETKINRIHNDAVKERVTFAQQFAKNEEDKSLALNLQTQILAATDPQERQRLIQQLQELVLRIAGDDKTKINLVTAIDNSQDQGIAKANFEQFQKSPEWITATGELSGMTNKAIKGLIASLEKYKKSAKNLDPKQIKNINNALKNLYKEQRKENPFGAIANMIDKAKERMTDVLPEMASIASQIDKIEEKVKNGDATEEEIKTLDDLKERLVKFADVGKISASEWVESLTSVYGAIKGAIGLFDDLAKAIGGSNASDVEKIFSVLDKAAQGAQIGASFGGYGAAIGGVVGGLAGLISTFADKWSGNENINKSIEVSTQKIRTLEREYKRLEKAIDDAYGTDTIGAQRLMMLNKEAELAELERQLELEKSRKAKNRDQDKIDDLRDKIQELRYEVENAERDIVLNLLDIGDAQDWAGNFVKGMIDAFREGENYMKSYDDAFRDMIDNMIAKAIMGKVIGERIEQMISQIQESANARAENQQEVISAKEELDKYIEMREHLYNVQKDSGAVPDEVFEKANKLIEEAQKKYEEIYSQAATPTPEEIASIREQVSSWRSGVKSEFDAYMDAFDVGFGSSETQLSALQQGLQSMSESTANALEAYMNSVNQQVYYHSSLLEQIRDSVAGLDLDVSLGVQSQMLLQLQNSYQTQQAIQQILEGVLVPSGRAFAVELIS